MITFWEDVTVTEELERIANHEALVIKYVAHSHSHLYSRLTVQHSSAENKTLKTTSR